MVTSRRSKIFVVVLTIAFVALTGCSKVPQEAIDATRAELTAAETAEAGTYAADQLSAARQALAAVDAEVAVQQDKLALLRSYKRTQELVEAADQAATAAREAAEAGRQAAQTAANEALATLQSSLQDATALHAALGECGRRPKGFAADLEALGGTLSGLADMATAVEAAIGQGDFLGASETAVSVQSQIDGLVGELSSAKAKLGC